MFKPTHIFHFGGRSLNNKQNFPQGVPVQANAQDDQGYVEWVGDDQLSVVGYTQGLVVNEFGSYVLLIDQR